jgi:hypothetical protein
MIQLLSYNQLALYSLTGSLQLSHTAAFTVYCMLVPCLFTAVQEAVPSKAAVVHHARSTTH